MSRSYSYSTDDETFSFPSSSLTPSTDPLPASAVEMRHSRIAGSQSNLSAADRSVRLSTGGSASGSSRRDSLPPTRQGVLKPEDHLKADALRLVKVDSNPLSSQAVETMNVLDKQKHATKEIRNSQVESSDFDWESNLSSWKDRRKSKQTYQLKALELTNDNDQDEQHHQQQPLATSGKRSKTFKELMEQKEQRSNGHGMYTYESEEKPSSESRSFVSTVVDPVQLHSKPPPHLPHLPPPPLPHLPPPDPVTDSARRPPMSSDDDFYFASTLTGTSTGTGSGTGAGIGTGSGTGTGTHPDLSRRRSNETTRSTALHSSGTDSVPRQPEAEQNVELQVQMTASFPEAKELQQKRTGVVAATLRTRTADSDVERKPWNSSTTRQQSETSATRSTNAYEGVTLRQRSTAAPQAARPYSYAYTPSTERSQDGFPRSEVTRSMARTQATANLNETRTSGNDFKHSDRTLAESLSKDRRSRSNWELNLGQSDYKTLHQQQQQQQQQKAGLGQNASSSKFKQALSLFQSKEAEVNATTTKTATVPALATTQRSVGKLSRPLVEDSKPTRSGYSGIELRRGSGMDTKPSTSDVRAPYQSDSVRLREFSRSTQGIDRPRSEYGAPEAKYRTVEHGDWTQRDRAAKEHDRPSGVETTTTPGSSALTSTHFNKNEIQDSGGNQSNVELGMDKPETDAKSNRGVERKNEETTAEDVSSLWRERRREKMPTKSDASLDTAAQRETESPRQRKGLLSALRYDSPEESPTRSASTVAGNRPVTCEIADSLTTKNDSRTEADDDKKKPETKSKYLEEEKFTDATKAEDHAVPVWKLDERRGSSSTRSQTKDPSEPKELYAFKYQTKTSEESLAFEAKDRGRRTKEETAQSDNGDKRLESDDTKTTKSEFKVSYVNEEYSQTRNKPELDVTKPSYADYHQSKPAVKDTPIAGVELYLHAKPLGGISGGDEQQQQQQQSSISDIFSKRSAAAIRSRSVAKDQDVADVVRPASTTKVAIARETARHQGDAFEDAAFRKEPRNDAQDLAKKTTAVTITRNVAESNSARHDNEPWKRKDADVASVEPRDVDESKRYSYDLRRIAEVTSEKLQPKAEEPKGKDRTTADRHEDGHQDVRQQTAYEVNFSIPEIENTAREATNARQNQKPAFELNFSLPELEQHRLKSTSAETEKAKKKKVPTATLR